MKNAWDVIREASGIRHEADAAFRVLQARDAEWRRLDEEAQADAKSWMERSIAIQKQEEQVEDERDRFKGELADMTAYRDSLKGELAKERDSHREASKAAHHWEEVATNLREENASIKGELAEAEKVVEHMRVAVQAYCDSENAAKAELAEARRLLTVAVRAVPTDSAIEDQIETFLAATPADQAQGEGALTCASCGRPGPGCMESAQVAALAKRVDALEAERPGAGWVGHYCDKPTACPHRMAPPAPPPPKAAGPGHAFVDCSKEDCADNHCCFREEDGALCSLPSSNTIHAVTPIPGRAP